jgi:hypothetical protein
VLDAEPGAVGTSPEMKKSNINEELIAKHHAVAYHGQSKEEIEEAHLVNRTFFED